MVRCCVGRCAWAGWEREGAALGRELERLGAHMAIKEQPNEQDGQLGAVRDVGRALRAGHVLGLHSVLCLSG